MVLTAAMMGDGAGSDIDTQLLLSPLQWCRGGGVTHTSTQSRTPPTTLPCITTAHTAEVILPP